MLTMSTRRSPRCPCFVGRKRRRSEEAAAQVSACLTQRPPSSLPLRPPVHADPRSPAGPKSITHKKIKRLRKVPEGARLLRNGRGTREAGRRGQSHVLGALAIASPGLPRSRTRR